MIKYLALCAALFSHSLFAQEIFSDQIVGLRVYGSGKAGFPVAGMESRPITIEFDVKANDPPDIRIRVLHCDRDWNVTKTIFVNDETQNRSKEPLHFEPAPAGVQSYRYHYSVRIPGIAGIDRLIHSGNYVFELVDEQWKDVLARGRFFVAENILSPTMKISNRSLPSEINPYNQVNKIEVGFTIPPPERVQNEVFYPIKLKVVDIYRNRQLLGPWRIDSDQPGPNTFVDGFGTATMKFIVDNVTPGNSYRRLDVRNSSDYPPGQILRSRQGADVSRFLKPPGGDNFGASTLVLGSRYADDVQVQFELSSQSRQFDSVFVVGDFDCWTPGRAHAMTYEESTQRYVLQTVLRRGAYDYQYVVGPNDWISLEGNDWRTLSIYSAFVYYRDDRYGGFDRIIGFVQHLSPGGNGPTTD